MRFSHAWLSDYAALDEEPARVGARLTDAGFPLDAIEGEGDALVYDIDIPPNRPDAMNHLGLAREHAALTGAPLRRPDGAIPKGGVPTPGVAAVTIEAEDLCARYAARVVQGVRVAPSPEWLRRRLESIGQRPISNVVDVTNFVLWELGHPLHPFDLARLEGRRIVVRRARGGESLVTLDGVARALDTGMLVIADARRPVALAGVMGGRDSQIDGSTRDVFLESAWFEPIQVRRTARAVGLRTDASHRFERGADPDAVLAALDRAARLIAEVAGGKVSDPPLDVHPRLWPRRTVRFRPARARALLGTALGDDAMREALERREFKIDRRAPDDWRVEVPSFRRDVEREADLIEEAARHAGYALIPARLPLLPGAPEGRSAERRLARDAGRALNAAGLTEAINYTMIEREECLLLDPQADPPALENPLQAQAAFLRTSLLPGLLRNAAHNLNHGLQGCHLYEIGTIFEKAPERPRERAAVAFVMAGRAFPEHWSAPRRDVDLYDARGATDLLAERLGGPPLELSSDRIAALEDGRALAVLRGGRRVGVLGAIAPEILARYGIDRPVVAAEILDLGAFAEGAATRRYTPLARHPAARRDLALILGDDVTFAAIARRIRESSGLPIADIQPFDRYRGAGVPAGSVSLAVQVVFQHPDRTLTNEEVQQAQDAIVATLAREFGARLRGQAVPPARAAEARRDEGR